APRPGLVVPPDRAGHGQLGRDRPGQRAPGAQGAPVAARPADRRGRMTMERSEWRAMVTRFEDRSGALGPALAERARAEGLLDVAYGFADSPLGRLLLVLAGGKLVTLGYPNEDLDEQ